MNRTPSTSLSDPYEEDEQSVLAIIQIVLFPDTTQ